MYVQRQIHFKACKISALIKYCIDKDLANRTPLPWSLVGQGGLFGKYQPLQPLATINFCSQLLSHPLFWVLFECYIHHHHRQGWMFCINLMLINNATVKRLSF